MKALVHDGNGATSIEDRPKPEPIDPGDVVVRVTRSTICTSDLHIIHGAVPRALPNTVLGHEFVGVVDSVGAGVAKLAAGDRVAVSCETFCGECFYCKRGWVNNCIQGGWELGCRMDGCQAEFVRVPFADQTCSVIPDGATDEDALFLGDIVATGQWGAEIAELEPGCSVAVIGAGPVGLATMMCAKLAEPGRIVAIDIDAKRLALAKEHGLADETIDASTMDLDAVEAAVRDMTDGRGADAVVEAAGGSNTFEMAWRVARPNAVVVISAMYEGPQTLPPAQDVRQEPRVQNGRRRRREPGRDHEARRRRPHRHELPYFEALRPQRYPGSIPRVRSPRRRLPENGHHTVGRTLRGKAKQAHETSESLVSWACLSIQLLRFCSGKYVCP